MNGPTPSEVEAAVRSVLTAMRRSRDDQAEVFLGKLFGLKQAEALPEGCREVQIAAGTVVTPLAHDWLKRSGIAIRTVAETRGSRDGEWGFVIESASGMSTALRRALLEGQPSWSELGGDHREAAAWVSAGPERAAAVVSDTAALAAWRACQVPGVRAAAVASPEGIARAFPSLGPNLLVIDPCGQSIASLRHLFRTYRRLGLPGPPDAIGGGHEDRRGDRPGDAFASASHAAQRPLADRAALDLRGDRGRLPAPW